VKRLATGMAMVMFVALMSACAVDKPGGEAGTTTGTTPAATASPGAKASPAVKEAVRILGYPKGADARADIAKAVKAAGKDGRFVLLDFGATWCVDCRLVEKFFDDPGLAPVLDESYHVVSVDVGEFDKNMDLFKKYAPAATGIPTFVMLSPEGKKLEDSGGDYVTAASDKKTVKDFGAFLSAWAAGH
jgi:thioredoxin